MLEQIKPSMPVLIEDLGMQFATEKSKLKRRVGIYQCECGVEFKAQTSSIKNGNTNSCGCYNKKRTTTHGLFNHRLYYTWNAMIQRTTNPKSRFFDSYGGRGISVCERWLKIENFIKDMYPSWMEGLSIDRINNDGNYEPSNCRWTTKTVQMRNTRLIRATNTSEYRGVNWKKANSKWAAQININGKHKHIGYFDTALKAAEAYNTFVINNELEHTKNKIEVIGK